MTDLPVPTRTGVLSVRSMSVDHSPIPQTLDRPEFLDVKPGDVVVVWNIEEVVGSESSDWYVAEVIFAEGSARDPYSPSLFQVWNVDTGVVSWINADLIRPLKKRTDG